MPLYNYTCQECHTAFEVKKTVSEYERNGHVECPTCHSDRVKRSLAGVYFASARPAPVEPQSTGHSCGCGGHCGH